MLFVLVLYNKCNVIICFIGMRGDKVGSKKAGREKNMSEQKKTSQK